MNSRIDTGLANPTWDKIDSWMCVLPPSRPSSHQLSLIRSWLEKHDRDAPIGVLGSTPEFVDLLIDLGFQNIIVFEKYLAAYDRMRAFRVHPPFERVVWGDWMHTLPQHLRCFTAILSDLTSGNVPYTHRAQFWDAVRNALSAGGVFIDRVLTGRPSPFCFEAHIESFSDMPINLIAANRFNCEIFFSSDLALPEGIIDTTSFYERIQRHCTSPRLAKLLQLVEKVTPRGCVWWYGKPWNELAPSYFTNYDLLETAAEPRSSWYLDAAYMYLLKCHA